ncbi:MAG: kinase [Thermoplasmatales archaeon]|jgi:D-glycero-alpha-D-manno-heptose-7-phosphate kinase|nr:kinase [Candidatus Thermoplasmatota archaeon]MCL6003606.1 kinase [Candidatus Thermoplasmatota archaeon]MDA8054982.1 kinase [Thermoplasmatales archaeon]
MKKISVMCPYRISFSGGGTDVSPFPEMYGGCVINATIDKGIRLNYVNDGQPLEISSRDILKSWSFSKRIHNSFLEGITTLFKERGIEEGRLSISGDVPPGTGLGTSSALVLGLLQIVKILNGEEVSKADLANETYEVEKNFFGVTLGKQDPYAISFGGLKYMEFSKDGFKMETFDHDTPFTLLLEMSTLMVYTGSSHNSSDELQEEVSRLREGSTDLVNRLLEIKRNTEEARESILKNDFDRFVGLVDIGWELKKGLTKNITNPKVDALIRFAKENGARTARLMGGGSEGFILLLADHKDLWRLQKRMMEHSDFVTRISFDHYGARSVPF